MAPKKSPKTLSCERLDQPLVLLKRQKLKKNILKHLKTLFVCNTCFQVFEERKKLKIHQQIHNSLPTASAQNKKKLSNEEQCGFPLLRETNRDSKSPVKTANFNPTISPSDNHQASSHDSKPDDKFISGSTTASEICCKRIRLRSIQDAMKKCGSLKCFFCGKTSRSHGGFVKHVYSHLGDKPYTCMICGLGFSGHVKSHMKTHPEMKPILCSNCCQILPGDGCLTHMKTHEGDPPLQCDFCYQWHQGLKALWCHKAAHLTMGQGYHECKECNMLFLLPDSLSDHRKTEHPVHLSPDTNSVTHHNNILQPSSSSTDTSPLITSDESTVHDLKPKLTLTQALSGGVSPVSDPLVNSSLKSVDPLVNSSLKSVDPLVNSSLKSVVRRSPRNQVGASFHERNPEIHRKKEHPAHLSPHIKSVNHLNNNILQPSSSSTDTSPLITSDESTVHDLKLKLTLTQALSGGVSPDSDPLVTSSLKSVVRRSPRNHVGASINQKSPEIHPKVADTAGIHWFDDITPATVTPDSPTPHTSPHPARPHKKHTKKINNHNKKSSPNRPKKKIKLQIWKTKPKARTMLNVQFDTSERDGEMGSCSESRTSKRDNTQEVLRVEKCTSVQKDKSKPNMRENKELPPHPLTSDQDKESSVGGMMSNCEAEDAPVRYCTCVEEGVKFLNEKQDKEELCPRYTSEEEAPVYGRVLGEIYFHEVEERREEREDQFYLHLTSSYKPCQMCVYGFESKKSLQVHLVEDHV